MTTQESYPDSAEGRARQTLDRIAHALAEAAAILEPGAAAENRPTVFPEPGERRADLDFSLPQEDEVRFREIMSGLGIGRETNRNATETGLKDGYVAVIEGGQAHKMVAELNVVLSDETTRPSAIIIAATPHRTIPEPETDKAKEKEITAKVLEVDIDSVGPTEYDVAHLVAYRIPGIQAGSVSVLNFGYEMDGTVRVDVAAGQLKHLGAVGHIIPVHLLRVDREYYDPDDPMKYRTLGPKNLIKVVDNYLKHLPESESREIGFVTSATYQPSREVDAATTMLEISREGGSRNVGVITYGTAELAAVKREEHSSQPALGQLAGEAHKAAVQVGVLRDLLVEQAEIPQQANVNRRRWNTTAEEIEAMDETQLRRFLIELNERTNSLHEAIGKILSGYNITKVLTAAEIQAIHDALDPGGPSFYDDLNQ